MCHLTQLVFALLLVTSEQSKWAFFMAVRASFLAVSEATI
jgi:hypothetical protein